MDFEACWRAERPDMIRAVFLLSADLEMASDIVDEVFAKVFARKQRGGIDDLRGYLWQSAFNEARRQIPRHRRVRPVAQWVVERASAERDTSADDLARAIELRDVIWKGLEGLDERTRQVLLLRYVADFTNAKISDQLNVPIGTIKSTVHRGLASLRSILETGRKD